MRASAAASRAMTTKRVSSNVAILIADEKLHTRKLVSQVLRNEGFTDTHFASDGEELLRLTAQISPRIVITSSRIPKLSGLEFTRRIRAGHEKVDRTLSIIVMTSTPTMAFLKAAEKSGVDEMLVYPFNASAVLARVEAVLTRPREFIDCPSYVGPCRRRKMLQDYSGPQKRATDAAKRNSGRRVAWSCRASQIASFIKSDLGLRPLDEDRPAHLTSIKVGSPALALQ